MKIGYFNSPIGMLLIEANKDTLQKISFVSDFQKTNPKDALLHKTGEQLNEYFQGKRTHFNLSCSLKGTDFQKKVWDILLKIPYGKSLTYKDVAQKINNPKSIRAVGAAIGKNPLSIIVPCHRVLGSNGSLTGYVGGIKRKKYLLELEGIFIKQKILF